MVDVDSLSRKELQALAKANGVKANGKSVTIRAALKAIFAQAPATEEKATVKAKVEVVVAAAPIAEEEEEETSAPAVVVVAPPAPPVVRMELKAEVAKVSVAVPPVPPTDTTTSPAKVARRRSGRIAALPAAAAANPASKPAAKPTPKPASSASRGGRFNRPTASSASRKSKSHAFGGSSRKENSRPVQKSSTKKAKQQKQFKAKPMPNFRKMHENVTASGLPSKNRMTLREEGRLMKGKKRGRTPLGSGRARSRGPRAVCAHNNGPFGSNNKPRFAEPTSSSRSTSAAKKKRPAFDLNASLKRKPTWQAHTGTIKAVAPLPLGIL